VTLIITVATRTAVYQASDRCVTWLARDGTLDRQEDDRNKAVVWCRRVAFAYTGLAQLGPSGRTDLWLAETLAAIEAEQVRSTGFRGQDQLFAELSARAAREFETSPWVDLRAEERRHAFVGVGWARFDPSGPLVPYRALVSNFHDEELHEAPAADETFSAHFRPLQPSERGDVSKPSQGCSIQMPFSG
jgi:hypothetical protein